jgi:hypothetical protein
MSMTLAEKIERLSDSEVLEAAQMRLPDLVGIDDPSVAAQRVAELAKLPNSEISVLSAEAGKAAKESQTQIAMLLRAVLLAVSEESTDQGQTEQAVDAVGHKEMVVGPEMYLLGVFLISAYTAWKTGGVHSTEETTTMKEDKNGRMEVKISKKVVYVDPQNPLTSLLAKILKK